MSISLLLYSIKENTTETNETRFYIYDSLGFCIRTNLEFFSTYEEAYKYLNDLLVKELKEIMSRIYIAASGKELVDTSKDLILQEKVAKEIYNHKLILENRHNPQVKHKI